LKTIDVTPNRTDASRAAITVIAALWCGAGAALCQSSPSALTAYYLNVASGTAAGPFNESNASSLQRLRLMMAPTAGPVRFDLAYEQLLEVSSSDLRSGFLGPGVTRTSGDWAPLQGTIAETDGMQWNHRLDRASMAVDAGESVEVVVGRQTISWATTLFLTPGDPFVPFNPEDPFREYRAGVDAARVRGFLGPFTDVDVVVRPATFDSVTTISALGRIRSVVAGVEVGGWIGALHDDPAISASVTATLAGAAARAEIVVRRVEEETVLRGAIGFDRAFGIGDRDLYVVIEYQYDEFGAASADDLVPVILSEPSRRGELLVLGRNSAAVQFSAQVHPLWSADALILTNLSDPSALFGPGLTYSVGDETTIRGGVFIGAGAETSASGAPGSEYGAVPFVGYLSLTAFF
jgi:hypothetical protein